jgi:hypothetical protein
MAVCGVVRKRSASDAALSGQQPDYDHNVDGSPAAKPATSRPAPRLLDVAERGNFISCWLWTKDLRRMSEQRSMALGRRIERPIRMRARGAYCHTCQYERQFGRDCVCPKCGHDRCLLCLLGKKGTGCE